jgi:hypothetical protein
MSSLIRSRSGNPASGFPPLDPPLRAGTSLKASAAPPQHLVREKSVKPRTATPAPSPRSERPPILTRAEVAPCTCPEHCERDHEHD